MEGGVTNSLRRILSSGTIKDSLLTPPPVVPKPQKEEADEDPATDKTYNPPDEPQENGSFMVKSISFDGIIEQPPRGKVRVVSLGFVSKMAEYMVASDVLVSKAGPGTISEAASLSLPVMLTSFLPGQEEGNIDFVIKGGFGSYRNDRDPMGIAEEVVLWLEDEEKMKALRKAAKQQGTPYAARDIAKVIGDSALKWKEINDANDKAKQLVPTPKKSEEIKKTEK